ncbi:MAG: TonB-dependent receptor [Deltaproteobacteria bacterium]|nr:TonB-dependent receptor [Deltaproteobacteria bacterium]MDQ3301061.1 TonB-dependent receptor [Myxococcota bacterium]
MTWACRVALLMLIGAGVAAAEPARTVRGVVIRERASAQIPGGPIAGASVLTERGAIAVTDVDGYFAITVAEADRELTIVATGYVTRSVRIVDSLLRIELAAASGSEVIEVTGKAPEDSRPLRYQLTVDEIRTIPGAGNDILRAAQVLPGVARIPFSFGGLVLRGTSPRDTAVYLDGIEVPLSFHFGGVTSFYPSGMLADLQLANGGFDAAHGRAQGGLVTLTTREPRTDRWRMGGSIGLFDSSVQAEGPWQRGGILIGLRRSYFDRIVAPFVEDDIPLPSYYDFQVRTTFGDARDRGRINPMIFSSIDRVASDEVSLTSMFVRVAAPYRKVWGPTTLVLVPWLGTNRLTFQEEDSDEASTERFSRPTYLGGLRSELVRDYRWGHLRGGAELSSGYLAQTQINTETPGGEQAFDGQSTVSWSDASLWSELRWMIDGDRFAVKPGVRVEIYGLSRELVVDPRLNIHQRLTDQLTLRQAIGRYHQPPTPGDVDARDGNPALDSSYFDQISLGLDSELPHSITAAVTGFFSYGRKLGVQVRRPEPGAEQPSPELGGLGPTFQLLLEKQLGFAIYRENLGRARSYGVEVAIKRNVAPWFALLSYTLGRSERTDDPRAGRGWRPFELDQRHNLQIAVSRQYAKWRLGARMQLVSGNPYSPSYLIGQVPVQDAWAATLPTFFTLDLRADRRWHRCWGDIVFYIDIQNATNRRNVEGREYDDNLRADADIRGLPIVPFIGVEFLPLI